MPAAPTPDPTAAVPQPTLIVDPDDVTELLLVRHGRSADVVPGTAEARDPGLHPEGERQVLALAERLHSKRIDAVYASHLRRAIDTARALAEPRGLDVMVDPDLEEVRLGQWSGGEFRRRAAARDPEWVAWSRTGRWDGIPGGEGDDVFRGRVTTVIDAIAARHQGQTVAVVVHGGVINAYLAAVLGIERTIWLSVENTSISAVHVTPWSRSVLIAGDCHHLYDPIVQRPVI